ncbi:MAG: TIR domain-containing protein [Candidatus Methanomethylicus sp.]|nr:TIR domain-containing protein [Candidatus Methanomethylicus sp.]
METSMKAKESPLFFSYARADKEFALKLAESLRSAGANLWIDQLDIQAGDRWDRAVEQALSNTESMLVILSPAAVASNNVMDEVSFAIDKNKRIVPVLYQTCTIPLRLRRLQYLDFTADFSQGLERLLSNLGIRPSTEEPQPAQPEPKPLQAQPLEPATIKREPPELGKKEPNLLIGAMIVVVLAIAVVWALWPHQEPRLPETKPVESPVAEAPKVAPKGGEVSKLEARPSESQALQPKPATGAQSQRALTKTPDTGAVQLSSFRISIMSAERCIIEWSPKESNMSETTLASHGVDISAMKSAIAKISATILKRNPANVNVLPGEKSDVMPGAAYHLSSLGVNDPRYDTFHIYVTQSEVTVSIFKSGDSVKRIEPSSIGIDWQAFREAVGAALKNLYRDKYEVEFDNVGIKTYSDNSWHYIIPYMLREKPKGV